jgi:hypothetical protein
VVGRRDGTDDAGGVAVPGDRNRPPLPAETSPGRHTDGTHNRAGGSAPAPYEPSLPEERP